MESVKMDAAAVRTLVGQVLAAADRLDEIGWPTVAPTDLPGSAAAAAAGNGSAAARDRLAEVVARMRTWAAAVSAAVTAIEEAESRHAWRLDGPR